MRKLFTKILKLLDLPDKFDDLTKEVKEIREALIAEGILKPFTKTQSPKQITERGHDLLKNLEIEKKLKGCDLLKEENLKNKDYVELYLICHKWVVEKATSLTTEIQLNSPLNNEESIELLTLFIIEKIKN